MYVSKKFDAFYAGLSKEEQLEAAKAVCVLCEDHERYMARKEEEMNNLLQQAIAAAAALDLEKLAKISAEVEKKKKVIPIEEFIDINFGL
jgi:hypothetical protein